MAQAPEGLAAQRGQAFSIGAGTSRRPHLLLLGGGHAHLQVLADIGAAGARWPAAQITLVSPNERLLYSGMLPGWVAGRYAEADCTIALGPLAAQAGVHCVWGRATALDADAQRVTVALADGRTEWIGYDLLSIDTGSDMHADSLAGAAEHGLLVRPLEAFVCGWRALLRKAADRPLRLAVVGSGAAGVELAFAARRALDERSAVFLLAGRDGLLPGFPAGARVRVVRALSRCGVRCEPGRAVALDGAGVQLESNADLRVCAPAAGGTQRRLACDAALIATGGQAPRWLEGSGLKRDASGRILTGSRLRSVSHPTVFAAGDVASREDAPHARSGVYAVRAGPPLSRNLRRALTGDPALEVYAPQAQALYLLACSDGTAIASRGPWSAEGRWVAWWKDRIDRGFIRRWLRTG